MIDGLRLVAALMVAAYHFLGTPTPHFWGRTELRDSAPLLHEIRGHGWLGVGFFFLISGFVERRLGRRLRQRLTLDMRPRDLSARPSLTRTR